MRHLSLKCNFMLNLNGGSPLRPYRPLAVGMTVGVAKSAAAILEYNAWAFSMGYVYREWFVANLLWTRTSGAPEMTVCQMLFLTPVLCDKNAG